jgi:hypothetical protein
VAGAYACTVPATRTDAVSRDELLARVAELEPVAPVRTSLDDDIQGERV